MKMPPDDDEQAEGEPAGQKDNERKEGQRKALRRMGGQSDGGNKFIQKAIKRPGALTAKAAAAGKSIPKFAAEHRHDSGRTGDEARFYENVLKR